jgi:7-carboxy-7-deazaguanine synthase (Cx14CxxC type)
MAYAVHTMFLTHQGEGANLGRLAVFIRFAGCNLWSGREQDRAKAVCKFCDTEFVGGERMTADVVAARALSLWPGPGPRFCVLTGGEPLLQVDADLLRALKQHDFVVAVETNGTMPAPQGLDWVCCSPKAGAPLVLQAADELKLVYPQPGLQPQDLAAFRASHRWLSPMDIAGRHDANTQAAVAYCRAHPEWRLAIQAHKFWGIA